LKQNQDSYVLKNLEKNKTNFKECRERTNKTRKIQNCFHLNVNKRDQNDISSQMLQRENKKKQILYKETNLTIAKKNYENQRTFLLQ